MFLQQHSWWRRLTFGYCNFFISLLACINSCRCVKCSVKLPSQFVTSVSQPKKKQCKMYFEEEEKKKKSGKCKTFYSFNNTFVFFGTKKFWKRCTCVLVSMCHAIIRVLVFSSSLLYTKNICKIVTIINNYSTQSGRFQFWD